MVHARISSLGWVVGGSETVVRALLEAIGPQGTLMAYAGWEDDPWHLAEWPEVGAKADWLTRDQSWDNPSGPGSPLAKLVEAGGQVLMLGAPLETLTILHHAEALVESPEKRWVTYAIPVAHGNSVAWKEVRDHDTSSRGAFPYERLVPPGQDAFEVIGTEALEAGCGRRGRVADASCHLFEAVPLVQFAVAWLEARFGEPEGGSPS